ncbi:Probable M43 cytophagalysin family metalloprotease precursor [Flavobacterium indicum GPTSA100-9 = DSM 17447]|uniref:Probable M43 cytophagalysin family metalloprotease n=1 Tax=Flavobacterium indicum (strain DSM 17447 / CIP 109464 / GPTSA100-9) TaxID=1094466 RepID=H8XPL1_FLAIG|nr:zinc metalloprotease [Flavobacterium indicum]CCG53285.1 Probable M43 cytophagalysin family metalloprotease precursor [Flavobacterium indicum GPTSA100-9 = DSM 17447]
MKKLLMTLAVASLLISCNKEDSTSVNESSNQTASLAGHRGCYSHEHLEEQLKADPTLAQRMNDIEVHTAKTAAAIETGRIVNGVLEIPVVVNVLYRTTAENISQAQIQSQIDVLNKDFNAQNSDYNTANNPYSSVRANVGIRFVLDAVYRKSTTKTSWGTNDAMKKSTQGGLNPTSPTTKLNLWVCTIGGGILGYAQFPGGSSATDGVVIDSKYFGTTGTATYPFNLGRTATHEVGHWMNLRHIWGDATCGSDLVSDTPVHNAANYGVPAVGHRSTCTGTPLEMYMNYMDYTDDRGMYMFSNGQKSRMLAIFQVGGSRASFR